jgi:hypothetical protein
VGQSAGRTAGRPGSRRDESPRVRSRKEIAKTYLPFVLLGIAAIGYERRMRFPACFAFGAVLLAGGGVLAQQPATATRDDGRKVLLYPDGTWRLVLAPADASSATPSTPQPAAAAPSVAASATTGPSLSKPASATLYVPAAQGPFGVWIDPEKWKEENQGPSDSAIKITFDHVKGDGYAMIISERIAVPMASVKDLAVANARKVAPDIQVTLDEKRTVNGKQVECVKMQGTTQGISFTYYSYYYGGPEGTLQVVTYTGTNLFPEFKADFDDFLNGISIGH